MSKDLRSMFQSAKSHKDCVSMMKLAEEKGYSKEDINPIVSARLKEIRLESKAERSFNRRSVFVRINPDIVYNGKSFQSLAIDPINIDKNIVELIYEKNLVRV